MEAIILLGGPGAGKGTVAESLTKQTSYLHVSTGNILREAAKSDKAVEFDVDSVLQHGQLAPDELILNIINERIQQGSADTQFMFDGFPRTLVQAKEFQDLFEAVGGTLTHVLNLEASSDILSPRLCGRRTCKVCGAIFHVTHKAPRKEGVCDFDGGDLFQRSDDNEATVMTRLDVYKAKTAPVIEFYKNLDVITSVDAGGSPSNTVKEALKALRG